MACHVMQPTLVTGLVCAAPASGRCIPAYHHPMSPPPLPTPRGLSHIPFTVHRLQVHELFVEHLKKSKVNVIGAFILANDVNRLQVCL